MRIGDPTLDEQLKKLRDLAEKSGIGGGRPTYRETSTPEMSMLIELKKQNAKIIELLEKLIDSSLGTSKEAEG